MPHLNHDHLHVDIVVQKDAAVGLADFVWRLLNNAQFIIDDP